MITTASPNQEENVNNCHRPFDTDVRTIQQDCSIFAYPRNEGLFSINSDLPQKKETYLPLSHYNDPYDVETRIVMNPKIVYIPDAQLKCAVEDFQSKGNLDNPGEQGRNVV